VTRRRKGTDVVVNPTPPSPEEEVAIAQARKRVTARTKPPEASLTAERVNGDTKVMLGCPHSDENGWGARIMDALGTCSPDFANAEMQRILGVVQPQDRTQSAVHLNAALAVVNGVRPRDELEAMLASQMAVTHALALDLLGRAKQSSTVPYMETCANLATKLQRAFVAQVEALGKLRRGGEQKVTVEHVHVHAGGQAIVGAVTTAPGGGDAENG
jgi:hypothetical protein